MKTKNTMKQSIKLDEIVVDSSFQMRESINEETVKEYHDKMTLNEKFPPLSVFKIDGKFYLADGFHRYRAFKQIGEDDVVCDVWEGTRQEAIVFGIEANQKNGLRFTNEDKRKAVTTLLCETDLKDWSCPRIAKLLGVSDSFVQNIKDGLSSNGCKMPETVKVKRKGKTYEMKAKRAKSKKTKKIANKNVELTFPSSEDKVETVNPNALEESDAVPMGHYESPYERILVLCHDLLPLLNQLSKGVTIIGSDLVVQQLKNLEIASHDLLEWHYKAVEVKKKGDGGAGAGAGVA